MLSSQMEEQKVLACLLSWLTSKSISRLVLVFEFDLLSWAKGVGMIQGLITFPPGTKILSRKFMPSHWLLHYWNNNPQKVDFPPKISYGEQEKTETRCQPEGKLVSQEVISHSQTTWRRNYVKQPWWDGGGDHTWPGLQTSVSLLKPKPHVRPQKKGLRGSSLNPSHCVFPVWPQWINTLPLQFSLVYSPNWPAGDEWTNPPQAQ